MIQIGSLVKAVYDGQIGLITKIMEDDLYYPYWIRWLDGSEGDHSATTFEVIA
jgi:hypothetical protein